MTSRPLASDWLAMSACVGCKRPFSYNPHRVPSVTVNGTREPICQQCVEKYNPIRTAKGQVKD